jgi:hypothetical protein
MLMAGPDAPTIAFYSGVLHRLRRRVEAASVDNPVDNRRKGLQAANTVPTLWIVENR